MPRIIAVPDARSIRRAADAAPANGFVLAVLLLAVKDQATKVRLEPSRSEGIWKLKYQVRGNWYEMVPVNLSMPLSQAVRRLAGMGTTSRVAVWLHRLCRRGVARAQLRLEIRGIAVDLAVTVEPASKLWTKERVTFYLPKESLPDEEARSILNDWVRNLRAWS